MQGRLCFQPPPFSIPRLFGRRGGATFPFPRSYSSCSCHLRRRKKRPPSCSCSCSAAEASVAVAAVAAVAAAAAPGAVSGGGDPCRSREALRRCFVAPTSSCSCSCWRRRRTCCEFHFLAPLPQRESPPPCECCGGCGERASRIRFLKKVFREIAPSKLLLFSSSRSLSRASDFCTHRNFSPRTNCPFPSPSVWGRRSWGSTKISSPFFAVFFSSGRRSVS